MVGCWVGSGRGGSVREKRNTQLEFKGRSVSVMLGSCGPGKLTEKGKFPKVLRGGCKRSFGPREQRSPKSLLHRCNPILHRCKSSFGWCKRLFGDLCSLGPKDLLHPPLGTFGNFPFSVSFPGPQLPNCNETKALHR